MGLKKEKTDHKYNYKEYCSWPEDERWELIDGIAYNMSPAPSSRHQRIASIIHGELYIFLKNKQCKAYTAPFDVMLPIFPIENEDNIDTIVQPDISVICDPSKITKKGCLGAPDLVVEILSPSTSKKDLNEKFGLYEKHGVKEYWVIDPGNEYIQVFHLLTEGDNSRKYDDGILIPPANWREDKNSIAKSIVLEGFSVDVKELFESLG